MTTEARTTKLIKLLDEAEQLAGQFTGGYSGQFMSAGEFHEALRQSIVQFKQGDKSQLHQLYIWFLPTSCWDDFAGQAGQNLANEISEILSYLMANE